MINRLLFKVQGLLLKILCFIFGKLMISKEIV